MLLWKCVAVRHDPLAGKCPEITRTTGHNTGFSSIAVDLFGVQAQAQSRVLRALRVVGGPRMGQIKIGCRGASFMRGDSVMKIGSLLIQEVLMIASLWLCLEEVIRAMPLPPTEHCSSESPRRLVWLQLPTDESSGNSVRKSADVRHTASFPLAKEA